MSRAWAYETGGGAGGTVMYFHILLSLIHVSHPRCCNLLD